MTKEELEVKIETLKTMITEGQQQTSNYAGQLDTLNKELANINKPQLTPAQLDDIQEAIEAGIEEFDFSDTGNFDIEYGIEYDGKVHCESHELTDTYELTEMIVKKVHALFVEANCPEDDQVNNITEVKKVI